MVDRVLVPYEQSMDYFAAAMKSKVLVTGNPVRKAISAGDGARGRQFLGLGSERRPVLLFLGGSLGAAEINALVDGALSRLSERFFVVHQTGRRGAALNESRPAPEARYYAAPFFSSEYPDILAAADLVVCRAGAGTVWELAVSGTPAVLIPLGLQGSRGDQIRNAELYAACGAARILPSGETTVDTLVAEIFGLLDDSTQLPSMSVAARGFAGPDAADLIARMICCEIYGTIPCCGGNGMAGDGAEAGGMASDGAAGDVAPGDTGLGEG